MPEEVLRLFQRQPRMQRGTMQMYRLQESSREHQQPKPSCRRRLGRRDSNGRGYEVHMHQEQLPQALLRLLPSGRGMQFELHLYRVQEYGGGIGTQGRTHVYEERGTQETSECLQDSEEEVRNWMQLHEEQVSVYSIAVVALSFLFGQYNTNLNHS